MHYDRLTTTEMRTCANLHLLILEVRWHPPPLPGEPLLCSASSEGPASSFRMVKAVLDSISGTHHPYDRHDHLPHRRSDRKVLHFEPKINQRSNWSPAIWCIMARNRCYLTSNHHWNLGSRTQASTHQDDQDH